MVRIYQLHPISVHFPIVLLLLGLGALILARARRFSLKKPWFGEAASWLLWLGTLGAWVAVGLGLLAEKYAPHLPPAWEVLADHKELGLWTAGTFTALSLWRRLWPSRFQTIFLIGWIVAVGLLFATAQHGGELVYDFGMGLSPK